MNPDIYSSATPIVDAMCGSRHEPISGLIWADEARKIEREKSFYRGLLEQISQDHRKTRARRLAESGMIFWDQMQKEVKKHP